MSAQLFHVRLRHHSWHFWLYQRGPFLVRFKDLKSPNNLCTYFWGLVWRVLINVFIGAAALLLIGLLIYGLIKHPWDILGPIFIALGVITAAALLIGVPAWVAESGRWDDFVQGWQSASETNPVLAYVRARKERLCPLITWDDEVTT